MLLPLVTASLLDVTLNSWLPELHPSLASMLWTHPGGCATPSMSHHPACDRSHLLLCHAAGPFPWHLLINLCVLKSKLAAIQVGSSTGWVPFSGSRSCRLSAIVAYKRQVQCCCFECSLHFCGSLCSALAAQGEELM